MYLHNIIWNIFKIPFDLQHSALDLIVIIGRNHLRALRWLIYRHLFYFLLFPHATSCNRSRACRCRNLYEIATAFVKVNYHRDCMSWFVFLFVKVYFDIGIVVIQYKLLENFFFNVIYVYHVLICKKIVRFKTICSNSWKKRSWCKCKRFNTEARDFYKDNQCFYALIKRS